MSSAIIREIEAKDLPELKSLMVEAFGEGWNLGRFEQNEAVYQALLELYLSIFLNSSTFGKVAELGGKVVGAALCSVKGEAEQFRAFQKDIAPHTLALLTATEDERKDITEHLSVSFQTMGQLLENRLDAYDGSLEFIVVSEHAQGRKIGKALWNEISAYFKSKNAKTIYLITDTTCNTGFYDNNGFTKAAAQEAVYDFAASQRKIDIFVYEYQF